MSRLESPFGGTCYSLPPPAVVVRVWRTFSLRHRYACNVTFMYAYWHLASLLPSEYITADGTLGLVFSTGRPSALRKLTNEQAKSRW